ncbi:MAG: hypothetical protein CSB33_04430 [Desulfobacterales bacterium]|nr:MAG: hypothetical protein CSB33_04430 [Desulfobacterales bacterium]
MAQENDIVLVYFEDNPAFFARIEDIRADYKPDWYHVTLLILKAPLQTVTWILRNAYINGDEFTMGGKRIRLEKIPDYGHFTNRDHQMDAPESAPGDPVHSRPRPAEKPRRDDGAKVISLSRLRKDKDVGQSS